MVGEDLGRKLSARTENRADVYMSVPNWTGDYNEDTLFKFHNL